MLSLDISNKLLMGCLTIWEESVKKVDPRMNDEFSGYFLGISLDNEVIREKVK